ncbi:PspC domain-containing protein [Bacillus tianshenii]|nr:PspC domain-containing protein [Bacillus tianshenii]
MKKLYRSRRNRKVSGVLGGIAEYINVDPTIIRIIFVVLMIATTVFPLALAYVIASFVLPRDTGVIES